MRSPCHGISTAEYRAVGTDHNELIGGGAIQNTGQGADCFQVGCAGRCLCCPCGAIRAGENGACSANGHPGARSGVGYAQQMRRAWHTGGHSPSDGIFAGDDGAVVTHSHSQAAVDGHGIQILGGDAGRLSPCFGVAAVNHFASSTCGHKLGKPKFSCVQIGGDHGCECRPGVDAGGCIETPTIADSQVGQLGGVGGGFNITAISHARLGACVEVGTRRPSGAR